MNKDNLIETFKHLKGMTFPKDRWFQSYDTVSFWVDGLNAFTNTTYSDFYEQIKQNKSFVDKIDTYDEWTILDKLKGIFLFNIKISERSAYNSLAFIFTVIHNFKARFNLYTEFKSTEGVSLLDHELCLVLSESYRYQFFSSHNSGIRFFAALNNEKSTFRPELGYSITGEYDMFRVPCNRVQWYSINHNNLHSLLFSDIYIHSTKTKIYKEALIDIEAFLCYVDLIYYCELSAYKISLFVRDSLPYIESDVISQIGNPTYFYKYSTSKRKMINAQIDLRDYFRRIANFEYNKTVDLKGWIQEGAIKRYLEWSDDAIHRNSLYESFVVKKLFNKNKDLLKKLSFINNTPINSLSCILNDVTLDNVERDKNIKIYDKRFLVVKTLELFEQLKELNCKIKTDDIINALLLKEIDNVYDYQLALLHSLNIDAIIKEQVFPIYTSRFNYFLKPNY